MQYRQDVTTTIDFFLANSYAVYCQWLNPAYSDPYNYQAFDRLGIFNYLLSNGAMVTIQNAKVNPDPRVQLIREFIYGWAKFRGLIQND